MSLIQETSSVRQEHRLDEQRLAAYLAAELSEIALPITIRQFKGGQSNPTFLIQSADRFYVLRKKPPGQLLPSAHQIEREYRVMKALTGAGVPVPRMRLLCEDASIIGTAFYVMDGVEGRVFRSPHMPDSTPRERAEIFDAMCATLAQLHSVDWRAVGLSDYGKPTNYISRQIARWSRQYESSKTHEIAAMDKLIAWLPENVPPGEEAAIAHGDFRLENLILHPSEPRVLAIIDWELATIGHPLPDLAYNCLIYHLPGTLPGLGFADIDIARLGIPSEDSYVAAYCRRTGRSSIPRWNFYLAFSLFRTAAILQGVYARALQKSASNADAREVGARAADVAEIAWARACMDK